MEVPVKTKSQAVARSIAALMQDDVPTAVELSSHYSGEAGRLYEKETMSMVRVILEHDWSPDPSIKPKVLAPLRVVAAAMELWGHGEMGYYADVSGPWDYDYDPETLTRLLHVAGREQHRLRHFKAHGVKSVEIRSTAAHPAPECRAHAGRIFPVEEAPLLPHQGVGCRCTYMAVPVLAPL